MIILEKAYNHDLKPVGTTWRSVCDECHDSTDLVETPLAAKVAAQDEGFVWSDEDTLLCSRCYDLRLEASLLLAIEEERSMHDHLLPNGRF